MLTHEQIATLGKIGRVAIRHCDGIPISVAPVSNREIKYPYEDFRKEMGLGDLRLNWLLGKNNMIAGGSVLNWIWGENTSEDIDFFFTSHEHTIAFISFIKSIGFELVHDTSYAETYFEPTQGLVVQTIGTTIDSVTQRPIAGIWIANTAIEKEKFEPFGTPFEVIDKFDLHVCKFAVDADYIYTTTRAIQDLLKLTIDNTGKEKYYFIQRVMKYTKKGFFPSSKVLGTIKHERKDW